jgi:hypothetical protein
MVIIKFTNVSGRRDSIVKRATHADEWVAYLECTNATNISVHPA